MKIQCRSVRSSCLRFYHVLVFLQMSLLLLTNSRGLAEAADEAELLDLSAIGATATVSSHYGINTADLTIDGNLSTFWICNKQQPAWLRIDLNQQYYITSLVYWRRQDASTGRIRDYAVHVTNSTSSDPLDWGEPVAIGTFPTSEKTGQVVNFLARKGRYLILHAISYADRAGASEINLYVVPPPFGITNPTTGSGNYVNGNLAEIARFPIMPGYDRYIITGTPTEPLEPIANWTTYNSDLPPENVETYLTVPVEDGEIPVYIWFGDSSGAQTPVCLENGIVFTSAEPEMQVKDCFIPSLDGQSVTLTAEDVDNGSIGGFYQDFPLLIHELTISCAEDLTPEEPYITLAPRAIPYAINLTAMNEAGNTATTQALVTVSGPLHWNPGNDGLGGMGTWSGDVWSDSLNYPTGILIPGSWTVEEPSVASFGGAAGGIVSLGSDRYASRVIIDTPGYVFRGGGVRLWLRTPAEIDVNEDALIDNLQISGSPSATPLVKKGPATLFINTYYGRQGTRTRTVEGTVAFNRAGSLGNEVTHVVENDAILRAEADNIVNFKGSIILQDESMLDLNGKSFGFGLDILRVLSGARVKGRGGSIGILSYSQTSTEVDIAGGAIEMDNGTLKLTASSSRSAILRVHDGGMLDLGAEGHLVLQDSGSYTPLMLSGGGIMTGGAVDLTGADNTTSRDRTITVADDVDGIDFTLHSSITDGMHPGSGLIKAGSGTLLLTGTNTYTGTTTINEGLLQMAGSQARASIVVASGARLDTLGALVDLCEEDEIVVEGTLDLSGGICFNPTYSALEPIVLIDYVAEDAEVLGIAEVEMSRGWRLHNNESTRQVFALPPLATSIIIH
jgi:autotransporter-associated beta strand protein